MQIALKRLFVPLTVVLAVTIVRAALVFIYPQETGVVVSILSPAGVRSEPLGGGLHWIVPLAEWVVIYPIYNQTLTMSSRASENQVPRDDSIRVRTADEQVLVMDVTVTFE